MIKFLKSWLLIFPAMNYSWQGIKFAMRYERAFQQEVVLGVPLMIYAALSPHIVLEKLALIGVIVLVWMAELINTAIEATIERISTEIHPLSKVAKDAASAAVMLAILFAGVVWFGILWR